MLPLYSLLNPPLPVPPICSTRQAGAKSSRSPATAPEIASSSSSPSSLSSSSLSSWSTSLMSSSPLRVTTDGMLPSRAKAPRGSGHPTKSKPQEPVNFAPFEDIDQISLQELSRFRISSFGQIHQCCEHIPYNSAKKDFFEKTGRESMEVFKYQFQLPGDDDRYTVMWDYNVGLVRMTPFFKCLGYAKTKPSQMLDKNLGLRDITPSVTGGAVSAQGYWMPYRCAKAVCATFCYCIAGALIPLFGPRFPSECAPPESSYYKEMTINRQIIIDATREVEFYRQGSKRNGPETGGATGCGPIEVRDGGMEDAGKAPTLPSLTQAIWPLSNTAAALDDDGRPICPNVPSRGWTLRTPVRTGVEPLANRSDPDSLLQRVDSLLTSSLCQTEIEPPRRLTESWRPKRRRRMQEKVNGRGQTVAPDTEIRVLTRKPEQELDKFKAAAVLVSLHKEEYNPQFSTAVADSSDDESRGSHQKKRPKAHSF